MNEPEANPTARVALFQKREIRRTLHNNEWWFAIVDVVAVLTDSTNPSGYLKNMRRRDPSLAEGFKGGGQIAPSLALECATAGGQAKSAPTRRYFATQTKSLPHIDELAAELWGLSNEELKDIKESLEEMR